MAGGTCGVDTPCEWGPRHHGQSLDPFGHMQRTTMTALAPPCCCRQGAARCSGPRRRRCARRRLACQPPAAPPPARAAPQRLSQPPGDQGCRGGASAPGMPGICWPWVAPRRPAPPLLTGALDPLAPPPHKCCHRTGPAPPQVADPAAAAASPGQHSQPLQGAHIESREQYEEMYRASLADPTAFWRELATESFHWETPIPEDHHSANFDVSKVGAEGALWVQRMPGGAGAAGAASLHA
jgi:hypothetical protein